ncbi:MAG: DinB family protein [bacterium]
MSVFTNPASSSAEQANAYTTALLDLLGSKNPLEVLRHTPADLQQAIDGLSQQQMGEPEAPGKWSVRHVLRHLADSELVWGYRLRMVLAHDRPRLTGYDQDLWAERLRYDEAHVEQSLQVFTLLRAANLRVLGAASAQDLSRVGVHLERGEESVEDMVRLCAGHDLLHVRQLARIRRALNSPQTAMADPTSYPYETRLNVLYAPLDLIDIHELVAANTFAWYNQTLCRVNDSVVRLGVVQGEYHWHKHDRDDEFFYVVEGRLIIDLEGRSVQLVPRQGFVVPQGMMHRTRAPERTVILMVESAGIIPTGD